MIAGTLLGLFENIVPRIHHELKSCLISMPFMIKDICVQEDFGCSLW